MTFSLSQLFPGIETGMNKIGFLFGAGTSKEAGYPLMPDLTKSVVGNLGARFRETFDEILDARDLTYDANNGIPNIEVISDLVIEFYVNTHADRFSELETEIRRLIVENFLSVKTPDITHHVRFLEALKRRAHGTSATVTLLTTNYDVLFELAAGEVGLRVETGFDGPLRRTFDPRVFDLRRGVVERSRFSERPELHINIYKLHGSIAWCKEGNKVIESGIRLDKAAANRSMILPRRRKVIDALDEPFDQLFIHTSRVLGSNCKYLVSCGFSFGDKHINDQLLFPKLRDGQIRLVALCGSEPDCIGDLKAFPAFHAGFPVNCYIDKKDTGTGTDLWRFSTLAELLAP